MVYNLYLLYQTPEPRGIQSVPTLSNPRTPWYTTCTYSIGPQNPMVYNLYLLYRTPELHGIQPVPTLSNPRTPWYTICTYSIEPQNSMVYNLYLLYRTPEPHGIQPVPTLSNPELHGIQPVPTLSNPRTPWYTTCTYSIGPQNPMVYNLYLLYRTPEPQGIQKRSLKSVIYNVSNSW